MVHEVQDCHHVGEPDPGCQRFNRGGEQGAAGNSPPEEDHGLRVGVLLEHHPEEGGAGGEHQLVGSHHVPVTDL